MENQEENKAEKVQEAVEPVKQEEKVAQTNTEEKQTNTLGLISFIFSMVGIVFAGLICGIVATVTGIIGVANFNSEKQKNKWMAITGLCVGAVEVVIMGLNMMM